MIALALAIAMFAAAGSSHSHFIDPFDTYMDGVKSLKPGIHLSTFANECGVPAAGMRAKYAVGGGIWEQVPDLAKAVYRLASDHFSTAQVWSSGRKTLVLAWSYDLEQEYADMYCFREDGKLKFQESKAWIFELPSGKGWFYECHWKPDPSGKLRGDEGRFLSMQGRPIPNPKLDADEAKAIEFQKDTRTIQDLKLPKAMLP